ncbi:MAG: RCC1 domain-containing protein [Candidatus Kapaibacterium sp.]
MFALFLYVSGSAFGQSVTVILSQPPPNQLRVSDLWRVQLFNNSGESIKVYLQGIATREGEGQIVDAQSTVFTLPPGRLAVKGSQLEPIKVNQSIPKYRDIVTRTGTVPSGEYEICVFVRDAATGEELGSDCITQIVERLSPPILIAPSDESEVQEPLPVFTWTPPVPAPSSSKLTYTLRIAEILGRQTAYDALQSNPAFYEKTNIPTTVYQYPTAARTMQTNKRYAWRITAYSNNVSLGESEVWEFTKKPQMMVLEAAPVKTLTLAVLSFKADRVFGGKGSSAALVKNPSSGGGGGKTMGTIAAFPGASTLDAQAWTWGNNEYGQLGTGGTPATARPTPKTVESLNHVKEIALGAEHGLAIELSGNIAAWGSNDFGQLGLGNDNPQNTPKWIPAFVGAIDVAAGNYHSVALKNDGTVWTWGYNRSGELGLGNKVDKDQPTKVSIVNVAAVAAGNGHTLALKSDGTVWAWGTNRNGQVDPSFGADPVIISPKKIEGLSNVKAIAAGGNFSLALLEDGTVKAWGANNSGQLGNGEADSDAKLVERFITGIKFGGSTGGTSIGKFKAVDVEKRGYKAVDLSKNIELGFVFTNLNGIVSVSTLNNVNSIDAGGAHAIALRKDSTVWTWGNNYWGTLGTGGQEFHTGPTRVTGLNNAVFIAAGSDHSFAVLQNGAVNVWGNNTHKQLGMSEVPASVATGEEDFATSPIVVPKP